MWSRAYEKMRIFMQLKITSAVNCFFFLLKAGFIIYAKLLERGLNEKLQPQNIFKPLQMLNQNQDKVCIFQGGVLHHLEKFMKLFWPIGTQLTNQKVMQILGALQGKLLAVKQYAVKKQKFKVDDRSNVLNLACV